MSKPLQLGIEPLGLNWWVEGWMGPCESVCTSKQKNIGHCHE